jgi:hypothetical protein
MEGSTRRRTREQVARQELLKKYQVPNSSQGIAPEVNDYVYVGKVSLRVTSQALSYEDEVQCPTIRPS